MRSAMTGAVDGAPHKVTYERVILASDDISCRTNGSLHLVAMGTLEGPALDEHT